MRANDTDGAVRVPSVRMNVKRLRVAVLPFTKRKLEQHISPQWGNRCLK
jgi:hypothetical protein